MIQRDAQNGLGAACLTAALLVVMSPPALAQPARPQPAPVAPAPNPAMEAAERAFNALPEAERRAIQTDLIWGSDFTATVSGSFGRRTYDSILTFERAIRSPADGILDPTERKLLAEAANRTRAAVRYTRMVDAKTGAALGLPLMLFSKREALPNGTRWANADGTVSVETANAAGGAAELPMAFERIVAVPGRKVTYKLLRPDFFVVAGESGPRSFYTRFAIGQGRLVGYSITYPTAQAKAAERVVIALANSFEPVAGAAPAPSATGPAGQPPQQQPVTPAANPGVMPPGHVLTGVVIAPGKVITVALAAACPDLSIGGKPARVVAGEAPAGLALLEAETGAARPLVAGSASATPGGEAVVLGFTSPRMQPELSITTGALVAAGSGPPRLQAPLHREAGGSLVLTRSGGLIGLVAAPRATPRLVAGIVPAESHALIAYAAASAAPPAASPLSGGALAARLGAALVPIRCGQPLPLPRT